MAKIDTTTIEGFETLTTEEKLAAVLSMDFDNEQDEINRYKGAASKANSEAAEWKRKYKALVSEAEQNKQGAEDQVSQLRQELDNLKRENTIAQYTTNFIANGYDESLAKDSAKALTDGDADKVFGNLKQFLEAYKNRVAAELQKGTPQPAGSSSANTKTYTREEFSKLSPEAKIDFVKNNPEKYKEIYGGC